METLHRGDTVIVDNLHAPQKGGCAPGDIADRTPRVVLGLAALHHFTKNELLRLIYECVFALDSESNYPIALDTVDTLTPADFALVSRRAAVFGGTPDLLALLKAEAVARRPTHQAVGFGR